MGPNSFDEKSVVIAMKGLLTDSKNDFRKALYDYQMGAGNIVVPVRIDLYQSGFLD